jgi:sugar phosphate isomerase/epimerase
MPIPGIEKGKFMNYSRRDFGRVALASLPVAAAFAAPKLNSKFGGVQVGAITYSFGGMNLDEVIKAYVDIGLGEMELMSGTAETAAGAPAAAGRGGGGGRGAGGGQGRGPGGAPGGAPAAPGVPGAAGRGPEGPGRGPRPIRPPMTEEQIAAARATPRAQEMLKWRTSVSMDKFKEIRKKVNDAGIDIALLCYNMNEAVTEDEMEYAFNVAKALGASAISTSTQVTVARRVAPIAEKHKMLIGLHGHDNDADPNETGSLESYAKALSYGKYNGVNLDIGHFTAANYDAIEFLKEHHARITNLHIKDRKKEHGPNMVWGEGDTPIKAVLQLLKKEKYKIPANIELEYRVPEGSDRIAEVKKCLAYCKEALA